MLILARSASRPMSLNRNPVEWHHENSDTAVVYFTAAVDPWLAKLCMIGIWFIEDSYMHDALCQKLGENSRRQLQIAYHCKYCNRYLKWEKQLIYGVDLKRRYKLSVAHLKRPSFIYSTKNLLDDDNHSSTNRQKHRSSSILTIARTPWIHEIVDNTIVIIYESSTLLLCSLIHLSEALVNRCATLALFEHVGLRSID